MRRILPWTAAVAAAVLFFLLITLPPRPLTTADDVDASLRARTVAGAYHVHTTRSDGAGGQADVASAAAKAGLRFVILTDHGDATRQPDPPAYRDGVLCLDAVEISTTGGHYVALDMGAAPYPLGGEPTPVVEDVSRLGGFGIAGHPDSAKSDLAWKDWTVRFDGIEWLSADSEWRNESRARLARVLMDYFLRPAGALALTLDRPAGTLARWDSASSTRPVVALAAHDAHGGIGPRVEGGARMSIAGVPSYEASFRSFAIRAILASTLTGRAETDARLVFDAIRRGATFTAIDALARPAYLDFHGTSRTGERIEMGAATAGEDVTFSVRAAVPEGASTVLIHEGREVARSGGGELRARSLGRGAYRVEIQSPSAPGVQPVPWLVSNPIYLNLPSPGSRMPPATVPVLDLRACAWHLEKDPASDATVTSGLAQGRIDYRLRKGEVASQFVALACDLPSVTEPFEWVQFRVRSGSPSRISVQLRFGRDGERRWRRSVYSDATARNAQVALADLVPAERDGHGLPEPTRATTILFVVDLTNARPGSAGEFTIYDLALARTGKSSAAPHLPS
jgi:hypothetical protein